jgi:hypothetical protein
MVIKPGIIGDSLMQSAQPTDWHHIWLCVKSFVEFLYFLPGIGIVIAAWEALDQIRLAKDQLTTTKDIAKATALREAVKLASDQLKFFADTVLPAQTAAVAWFWGGPFLRRTGGALPSGKASKARTLGCLKVLNWIGDGDAKVLLSNRVTTGPARFLLGLI